MRRTNYIKVISILLSVVLFATQPVYSFAAETQVSEIYDGSNDSTMGDSVEEQHNKADEGIIISYGELPSNYADNEMNDEESSENNLIFYEFDEIENVGGLSSYDSLSSADFKYYTPYEGATYSLEYYYQDDGTICINGYSGTDEGQLVIPARIDDIDVTTIGSEAFAGSKYSGELRIPEGIKIIEARAFAGCSSFDGNLTIPNSVVEIKKYAFAVCSGLIGSLRIPDSVTIIGEYAFRSCTNLKGNLILGSGLSEIGEYAFQDCGFTGKLDIPDNVTSIGAAAFLNCSGFDGNLIISNNIMIINPETFKNCACLTGTLSIPDSVVEIGDSAFYSCRSFSGDLSIPDSVTKIGARAFYYCDGLNGTLKLPSNITEINTETFKYCGFTGSLTIPNSVKYISSFAFAGCKGFTGALNLPLGLEELQQGCFGGCSGFKGDLIVPDTVTILWPAVFMGCSGFDGTVILPDFVLYGAGQEQILDKCTGIKKVVNKSSRNVRLPAVDGKTWKNAKSEDVITAIANGTALRSDYEGGTDDPQPDDPDPDDTYTAVLEFGKDSTKPFKFEWTLRKLLNRKPLASEDLSEICLILSRRAYGDDGKDARVWLDEALLELNLVNDDAEALAANQSATSNRWHIRYNSDEIKEPAHTFALKTYKYNGKTYNIITIVIRGTLDDVDNDLDWENMGFAKAVDDIYEELEVFLDAHDISPTDSNNRYLITGHSLGGAVANLLQANIIFKSLQSPDNEGVFADKITCYTYACPITLWSYDRGSADFGYSMNFISQYDAVQLFSNNFAANKIDALETLNKFNISYQIVSRIMEALQLHKEKDLLAMRYGFDIRLGSLTSNVDKYFKQYSGKTFEEIINGASNPIDKLAAYFGGNGMHSCDMYMALIKDSIDNHEFAKNFADAKNETKYGKFLSVLCPVDVKLVDKSSNETIALIVGDEIIENKDDSVQLVVKGDHKFVMLPQGSDYIIQLLGTNNGSMDYVVQDIETDSNGIYISNTKKFDNVVLFEGKTMESVVEDAKENSELQLFIVDEDGTPIKEINEDGSEEAIPDGFYIKGLNEAGYTYTGSQIKPAIKIYDGSRLLTVNKDYTITYKNNTNVASKDAKKNPPTIIIKGKGNYNSQETETFTIVAKNIGDEDITVAEIPSAAYNKKKSYTPVPAITFGKIKLANKKQFTIAYYSDEACTGDTVVPKEGGKYYAKISGINNFTGSRIVPFEIASATQVPVSKLTIGKIADQPYNNGAQITPKPTVKNGKTVLAKDTHYTLSWGTNTEIGTGKVIIKGVEPYVGTRTVTFKITGIPMNKVTIGGIPKSLVYDGTARTPALTLSYKANKKAAAVPISYATAEEYEALSDEEKAGIGCIVAYKNNTNVGTAIITLKGIHGCSGTVSKTFKITPFVVTSDPSDLFKIALAEESYPFAKGGVKPKPVVKYRETLLTEGKDYTLAYVNNAAVNNAGGKKRPTIKVIGKGNFKGTDATTTFKIAQADMMATGVKVVANDIVFQNKAGKWVSKFSVMGSDGKVLKDGTDYDNKNIIYSYDEAGTELIDAKAIVPVNTTVYVTVKAKGVSYSGSATGKYRVIKQDISKLMPVINPKTFTGKEVRLTPADITWKSGEKVVDGVTFEIDATTYKNNINKGKATVVVRGTGENWGGSKTVIYVIGLRKFLWWWR